MPLTKEDPEYHWVARCLILFEAPRLPAGLTSVPVAQGARTVGISLGPQVYAGGLRGDSQSDSLSLPA